MSVNRRHLLATAAALLAAPASRAGDEAPAPLALAASWRGPDEGDPLQLGVLQLHWAQQRVAVRWQLPLPGRAHGLLAEPDGTLLVVAVRPGTWLLRASAQGRVLQQLAMDDEPDGHRLDGHALASADGAWLYTAQTDRQGRGWLAVRDRRTLRTQDRWPTHGVDPHQLLLHPGGDVMLANGGIRRTADGRKRDLHGMDSSLVRLAARDGALQGRWTLPDPRLSLRHLAWARPADGRPPLLGVALQAEHDDARDRAAAPVLAVWDGMQLQAVEQAASVNGYAGDICAAGPGGFAVSAQHASRGLAWWPQMAGGAQPFAALQQPCALAAPWQGADAGAVLLAGARGVARWHPSQAPQMLAWPQPMVLDNHWVVLAG
ncbi:MAG: hypothetical protein RJA10_569 [Pseudomonadota bacterium]